VRLPRKQAPAPALSGPRAAPRAEHVAPMHLQAPDTRRQAERNNAQSHSLEMLVVGGSSAGHQPLVPRWHPPAPAPAGVGASGPAKSDAPT
jgi:hypothetical protein